METQPEAALTRSSEQILREAANFVPWRRGYGRDHEDGLDGNVRLSSISVFGCCDNTPAAEPFAGDRSAGKCPSHPLKKDRRANRRVRTQRARPRSGSSEPVGALSRAVGLSQLSAESK